jgi:hypothetical protein
MISVTTTLQQECQYYERNREFADKEARRLYDEIMSLKAEIDGEVVVMHNHLPTPVTTSVPGYLIPGTTPEHGGLPALEDTTTIDCCLVCGGNHTIITTQPDADDLVATKPTSAAVKELIG